MLFSSLTFLFYFLPTLLLVYYLSPKIIRNYVLLLFSLVFFAWGGVSYSLLLILSILVNHIVSNQIRKDSTHRKTWLIVGLVFNVGLIVFFKYLGFFIDNINIIGEQLVDQFEAIPPLKIILPIGISFFTFQQMSFLWDTYREPPQQKLRIAESALYISFFPQLIAGPIVRYKDIIFQIRERKESLSLFESGVRRFCIGLFKKIIFANTSAQIADAIMEMDFSSMGASVAWLGIAAYALQIYYDFSGYSDMAIGLGRMFGFKIFENFNHPYISLSIKEFWRRWHISLSIWFRDYVYIPLGGSRRGKFRTYYNLFIVFLLTGFWHGATWSFVFWGLFHGTFLVIERIGFDRILLKTPTLVRWSYTMFIVLMGWVFFRIESFESAVDYVGIMFGSNMEASSSVYSFLDIEKLLILAGSALFCYPWIRKITNSQRGLSMFTSPVIKFMVSSAIIVLFIWSVLYINSGSYNPFIYLRF